MNDHEIREAFIADGTIKTSVYWVIFKNGAKSETRHGSKEFAETQATILKKMCESSGEKNVNIEVKQVLLG